MNDIIIDRGVFYKVVALDIGLVELLEVEKLLNTKTEELSMSEKLCLAATFLIKADFLDRLVVFYEASVNFDN